MVCGSVIQNYWQTFCRSSLELFSSPRTATPTTKLHDSLPCSYLFFFFFFLLHLNNKGRLFTNASGSKKEYTNGYCPDMSRTAYCTPLANNHSGCNIQSVVVLVWHTVKIYTGVGFVWNQISNVAISAWHPRNDHWIDSHHRNEPMVIDSIKFNYQQAIHGCDFHMYRFYCGETHLQRRSSVAVVYCCKAAEIWGSIE